MRLGRSLVILQVALSTVLLAGAGLLIRSLQQLESVDVGFTREGIVTMEVTPEQQSSGPPQWLAAQAEILGRIRRIPGVRYTSWSTTSPFSGRDRGAVLDIPGFVPGSESAKSVHLAALSPEYFETFDVPLLLGRTFTARDDATAPKVAILNETATRFYFGNANPIGRKVRFANYPGRNLVYEIVGVVKGVKHDSLRDQPTRFIYLPIPQSVERINRLELAVRCTGDAAAFAPMVRQAVQDASSIALIDNVSTVEKQIERSLRRERLITALSTAFGALALALACIGLHGILAYMVARRTNEIGLRMALGATRGGVIWLILREALMLAGSGIALGLPAVLALSRIIQTLLYGVAPFDLPAFSCTVLLLVAFAAIAAFVPARRASRLDAMSALRCE
jgi:predicted permease